MKHHKPNNPVRPIVTCRNTALYNTSKFLADILSALQNHNSYFVDNSFAKKISHSNIDDDEVTISFDVVSLFTAIPVDRACEHIRNKLTKDKTKSLQARTKLSIDDIITLLRFTFSNSYFIYNKQAYKQIHGCAIWVVLL